MALEDMITYLIRFGFSSRYLLSRDLLTLDGLYGSTVRCTYIDKSEDAWAMAGAIGQVLKDKKSKGPLVEMGKRWHQMISARDPDAKNQSAPGTGNAAEFLTDYKAGFGGK